ncbi:hypothetical protein QBC39DRAFT_358481 [Podospora conica]|nr:hypothetical protein QBC39DRAFT_358481 [Schizothecium conicum]
MLLNLTRPWYSRPMAKNHPHTARVLLLAKDYVLMVAMFLILACWIYPVFHALDAIYDFDPSFMARYSLMGLVFLIMCHARHWIFVHTSDPVSVDENGVPIRVRRDGIDPNLIFTTDYKWRQFVCAHHSSWGVWTIAISITTVYSLVIFQLAKWRLLLEEQSQTPMNQVAWVAIVGTLVFMVLHLVQASYHMSRAAAGVIGQLKIPREDWTDRTPWSGLWHAGAYLV